MASPWHSQCCSVRWVRFPSKVLPSVRPCRRTFAALGAQLLLITASLANPPKSWAATVPVWRSISTCQANSDQETQIADSATQADCGETVSPLPGVNLTLVATGHGEASVSPPASQQSLLPADLAATAIAGAEVIAGPEVAFASVSSAANASVDVYFVPRATAAPPFNPGPIPFVFQASGFIVDGTNGAGFVNAFATLAGPGLQTFAYLFDSSNFLPPNPTTPNISLTIDGVYHLQKAASCSVVADIIRPNASCSAFVDPAVVFDQAAFDAQWGQASFPLADYYTLEVSPNLVPEPLTSALAVWALAAVGLCSITRSGTGLRR